jgi:hypothetical protein
MTPKPIVQNERELEADKLVTERSWAKMFNNGNGLNGTNGNHRWWRKQERDLDLAAYRRLAMQLHQGLPRVDTVSRSVLVVTPNETRHWAKGCVTLAACMAEELCRPVLLVDAEAKSQICGMLGSPETSGLKQFLATASPLLSELVLPTSQPNLFFLPAGSSGLPLSASPENSKLLLSEARKYWDFVVIAGGPVLRNSFALAMAPNVGRVLLLVSEYRTHIEDIDAAQMALEECRAKNVSLVLTESDEAVR